MKHLKLSALACALALTGLFAATATAATATAPLVVSATLDNECSLFASSIDLGTINVGMGGGGTNHLSYPGQNAISVMCNQGTAWSLDADGGLNYGVASGATNASDNAVGWDGSTSRNMANAGGTALLSYQLYPGSSDVGPAFGNVGGADTPITGTGDGTSHPVPVTIDVTQIGYSPAGSYSDTVNLTLTY